MHIMVAAPEYGRLWGGIGTYLEQLIRGSRGRHTFTILGGAAGSERSDRVRVIPFVGANGVMANYSSFQRAMRRRLRPAVQEHRPDLLIVHHAQMPDLLAGDPGCPVVVTTHTTILGQARGSLAALRSRSLLDATERTTLSLLPALMPAEMVYWHRVKHALFVSDEVRSQVERAYAPPLLTSSTIPNGLAWDAPSPSEDRPRTGPLLFGGRLLGMKGLAVLLRALARMPAEERRLDIAGAGDLTGWGRFAALCGLRDSEVSFLGGLPHPEYLARLRAACAFVLPSFTESCPFSLIEALATGTPIVASAVGGVPDMVDESTALLVPPGRPDALADALHAILTDDGRRSRLASNARARWAERFTGERMADATFAYFERVLAAR